MNIIIDTILIIFALGFLIIGSELVMKGAVILAKRMKISDLAIASTLIAFGTGLPTIAVNIALVFLNSNGADTAVGNALGTNFVNIGLGLGIPAFLLTIITKYQVFEKEIPVYLAISCLVTSFALDESINRVEGMIIFAAYLVTLYVIYQYSLREKLQSNDSKQVDLDTSTINTTKVEDRSIIHALINVLMGFVLLIGLSVFLALFAPILSEDYGISQYVLGLTVIGIGTSLPMIITSAKSALKGYVDIILGNVFGSTIANMALGIGLPAMIKPLSFNKEAVSDVYYFSILNILVVFGILIEMKLLGRHNVLNRVSGILIIMFYLGYLVVRIV